MQTNYFVFLIGGIVVLHFIIGIAFLLYKISQRPRREE